MVCDWGSLSSARCRQKYLSHSSISFLLEVHISLEYVANSALWLKVFSLLLDVDKSLECVVYSSLSLPLDVDNSLECVVKVVCDWMLFLPMDVDTNLEYVAKWSELSDIGSLHSFSRCPHRSQTCSQQSLSLKTLSSSLPLEVHISLGHVISSD